jgi:hypothetical protein
MGTPTSRARRAVSAHGVDGERHAKTTGQPLQHGTQTPPLLRRLDGIRARTRGFSADVDHVCAPGLELERAVDVARRIERLAAVRRRNLA